jgi:hypothetical protein
VVKLVLKWFYLGELHIFEIGKSNSTPPALNEAALTGVGWALSYGIPLRCHK